MLLDLTDEETRALLNLLIDTIEADRYPNAPRVRLLREILAKCGEVGGLPPECVFRGKSATDSGMKSATDSDLISAIPI